MATVTPTSDFALTFTPATGGGVQVDIALTPQGDVALVSGITRLGQDIQRWLLTPLGSYPFEPTYGNPEFSLLTRPMPANPSVFGSMIRQAEATFMAMQAQAAAQGYLTLDEQVASFGTPDVTAGNGANGLPPGSIGVVFTITTRAGTSTQVIAPFVAQLAA